MTFGTIEWALVALISPLVTALLLAVAAPVRHRGMPAAWICLLGSIVAFVAALAVVFGYEGGAALVREAVWLQEGDAAVASVGIHVDAISSSMLVVVTLVALCVQIFSVSYMHDEPPAAFGRYFTFHALFLFSMNLLVLSPNLLQLFAGWELVGLTSYLLIGFYFAKRSAAKAAVKAFWMTKFADMGFLFGLLLLFAGGGSFGWDVRLDPFIAMCVTLLLFLAVAGKSAQFPLHIWLPDAMEGPTPVSALLHAATMVAAGVYLIVRADPLFAQAEVTREVMLWVGAVTAAFASGLALVQNDIKKVLAYSTCSQLGYMVAALGAGSAFAGYFHLGTHAFFKALLFLAAGSVIHAVHSNDLRDMGGLGRKMPVTAGTFAIGAFALAGVPPLSGFFSKDHVLTVLEGKGGWIPWTLLLGSAFLTALYMGRVLIRAFLGAPSEKAAHALESGPVMLGPLVTLALPAVGAGFAGGWLAHGFGEELHLHVGLTPIAATACSLGGLTAAWGLYRRQESPSFVGGIARLDEASWVDRAWQVGYRKGLLVAAGALGWIDRYVIDGVMNLFGWGTVEGGAALRRIQTGRVADYAYAVIAGAVLLLAWGSWR